VEKPKVETKQAICDANKRLGKTRKRAKIAQVKLCVLVNDR
jgi:hypothetical protein